jgi:hypothetical protein
MSQEKNFDSEVEVSLFFKKFGNSLLESISISNIQFDAYQLNLLESHLGKEREMDLHYSLILNNRVSEYHRSLAKGQNILLQDIDPEKIIENYRASVKSITSKIFETITDEEFNEVFSKNITGSSSSFSLQTLKDLYLSLTEGGSPIGILQLFLDLVGLIPGLVGATADVINAIIYFFREKWLLGTISLLAGLLFGAGDVLKLLKPAAIPLEAVMVATAKGGAAGGVQALSLVPKTQQGLVVRGMRFIAKNISSILAKANSILSTFFKSFLAKAVNWVPGIGPPLEKFFEKIGKVFSKYSEDMNKISREYADFEKKSALILSKGSQGAIEKVIQNGGKLELDSSGKLVNILDSSGKKLGSYSTELLTNPTIWNKKSLGFIKTQEDALKYLNAAAILNPKLNSYITNSFKFLGVTAEFSSKLAAFVGKQIIKFITGEKDPSQLGFTEGELEYHGNAALSKHISKKIRDKKKETGQKYVPEVTFSSEDKEDFKTITDYHNSYAKITGQPEIIPVVYNKFKNEKAESEVSDFFNDIASGKITTDENGNWIRVKTTNESSLKYIKSFYEI